MNLITNLTEEDIQTRLDEIHNELIDIRDMRRKAPLTLSDHEMYQIIINII